ncbi:MAG: hypothetical protein AAFM91_17035 [Pseudomonadota bacterium]
MKELHKVSRALILIAILPIAAAAESQNLLKDPGFEMRTPASEGGWRQFETSFNTEARARTGERSMFNGGFSRTVPNPPYFIGMVSGSYQELSAEPGSRWRLTGYGATRELPLESSAFGILQVSFFDADGNDLGTVETAATDSAKAKTSNEINKGSPGGEWIFLDTGIATAPDNTTHIHAFTLYVDYSGSNISQGVHFDDLTLCELADDEETCD